MPWNTFYLVGFEDGHFEGWFVGVLLGSFVGQKEGYFVGFEDGFWIGDFDGSDVGFFVGCLDGFADGLCVGALLGQLNTYKHRWLDQIRRRIKQENQLFEFFWKTLRGKVLK